MVGCGEALPSLIKLTSLFVSSFTDPLVSKLNFPSSVFSSSFLRRYIHPVRPSFGAGGGHVGNDGGGERFGYIINGLSEVVIGISSLSVILGAFLVAVVSKRLQLSQSPYQISILRLRFSQNWCTSYQCGKIWLRMRSTVFVLNGFLMTQGTCLSA